MFIACFIWPIEYRWSDSKLTITSLAPVENWLYQWIFDWINLQADEFDCDVILYFVGVLMILETDADRVLKIITALKQRPSFEWYFLKSSLLTRSTIYLWTEDIFQVYFFFLAMIPLEVFPVLLGFSLITSTLVCLCFGLHSLWCVLFDGRGTLVISAESELIRIVFCLRDVICFFVGPIEDQYFEAN